MLVLNPNGPFWWQRPESDLDVFEKIAVSIASSEGHIVSVAHDITPTELPDQIDLFSDLTGTTFSAPHLEGLFPILEIKFLNAGVMGDVVDFDDVPDAAENLISYRKLISGPKRYDVTVTVVWEERDTNRRHTETRPFYFIIVPNYSPGRDRLVEEVNARRI